MCSVPLNELPIHTAVAGDVGGVGLDELPTIQNITFSPGKVDRPKNGSETA
jgi:hypothetical protein